MWSQMTPNSFLGGAGIVSYNIGECCRPTIQIKNYTYCSRFCNKCQKKSFAGKYSGHAAKHPEEFYEFNKNPEGQTSEPSKWKSMNTATINGRGDLVSWVLCQQCRDSVNIVDEILRFTFCQKCQKQTVWAKYPKTTTTINPTRTMTPPVEFNNNPPPNFSPIPQTVPQTVPQNNVSQPFDPF